MTSDFGCLICSTSQGWAFQSASMLRVWVCKLIWRALSGTGKTETPNYQTCLNTFSLEFGFSPWHSLSSCVFEVLGCFPSQSLFSLSAKPHLMTQWDLFVVFFSFFFFPAVKFWIVIFITPLCVTSCMLGWILSIQWSYLVFYQLRICASIFGFKVKPLERKHTGFLIGFDIQELQVCDKGPAWETWQRAGRWNAMISPFCC